MTTPTREEIDPELRWDLDDMYEDPAEWEQEYEEVQDAIDELQEYDSDVVEDPAELNAFMEAQHDVARRLQQLNVYAQARRDVATDDQQFQAMKSKASQLYSERKRAISFLRPAVRQADHEELIEEEPGLEEYRGFFEELDRMAEHSLSGEVEEAVADLSEAFGNARQSYKRLTETDIEFPELESPEGEVVEVRPTNATELLKHDDREFREEVWRALRGTYADYRNTIASLLEGAITEHSRKAAMRNYDSSRQAALKPKAVPEEVYDTLVEAAMDNVENIRWEDELRAEVLEVDDVQPWDRKVEIYGEEPEIPYEEAQEIILEAVEPLGEEYQDLIRRAFEEDWIDVRGHQDKRGGAYSNGAYDAHPIVLMNSNDDLSSLYTMAHELGHAVNRHLSQEEQPFHESSNDIFTAEVASTFNEQLLTEHLRDSDDDMMRMHALKYGIDRIESLLFGQARYAAFEQQAHAAVDDGEPLTADRLDEIYASTFPEPDELEDVAKSGWARVSHFFRPFYVYQYATGVSAAISLADDVLEGGEEERERYMEFLAAGSEDHPTTILDEAGVDMESPEPVYDAIWRHHEMTEELLDMVEVVG